MKTKSAFKNLRLNFTKKGAVIAPMTAGINIQALTPIESVIIFSQSSMGLKEIDYEKQPSGGSNKCVFRQSHY